ncbi:MAG: TRAP transporter substrate-binding protein [Burkholderiales bacterium]
MPAASTTLRMGGYQGPASVHTRGAHLLAEELGRRTNGACGVAITDNITALGRQSIALFDMVEGDELDLCYFASSYLVQRVPNLAIFDLPFTISSRQQITSLLDTGLGRDLAADVAARTGFEVLGFWDNGCRHLSNRVRPIARPDDCRGLVMRTMNSAVHLDTFRALGFEPRFIDVKDFVEAVRSHTVDAQENPLTNTVNFKIHATHRFVSLSAHFYGVALVLGNAKRIGALPSPVRKALQESVAAATKAQRAYAVDEDEKCLAALLAAGVEVIESEAFDRAAFVRATADVVSRTKGTIDAKVLAYFGI